MQTTEITAGMTPMRTSLKLNGTSSTVTTMSEAADKAQAAGEGGAVDRGDDRLWALDHGGQDVGQRRSAAGRRCLAGSSGRRRRKKPDRFR